jgi:hypothetical protein
MEDLDLRILYVPDEWTSQTDLTFIQVQEHLKLHGLLEVDIAIMHGCFQYQLNGVPGHIQHHKESNYLSIVRYYINIGHFHKFSHYERIVAQGSFDRIAMGEEDPKGATLMQITREGEMRFDFIENTKAKIYRTITFRSMDIDRSKDKLHRILRTTPHDSHIRIRASKEHPLYAGLDSVRLRYPDFQFTRTTLDKVDTSHQLISTVDVPIDYIPVSITAANIVPLLLDVIDAKYTLTPSQHLILVQTLEAANE